MSLRGSHRNLLEDLLSQLCTHCTYLCTCCCDHVPTAPTAVPTTSCQDTKTLRKYARHTQTVKIQRKPFLACRHAAVCLAFSARVLTLHTSHTLFAIASELAKASAGPHKSSPRTAPRRAAPRRPTLPPPAPPQTANPTARQTSSPATAPPPAPSRGIARSSGSSRRRPRGSL